MTEAKYAFYTRLMLVGAAALLILTAAVHGATAPRFDATLAHSQIADLMRLRAVWLLYASHLVLLAAVLIYAAIRPGAVTGPLLFICGLIPAIDALVMVFFIGAFPDTLLGLAAVLVFGAVARGTTPVNDELAETAGSREGP